MRQKFTGYERDAETGLDYAQARYYASAHGRFTSPDPLLESGRAAMPQSWNRYAYVLNNPLSFTDPTGLGEQGGNAIDHPLKALVVTRTDTAELAIGTQLLPQKEEDYHTKLVGEDDNGNVIKEKVPFDTYLITYTVTQDGEAVSNFTTETYSYVEEGDRRPYFDPPTKQVDVTNTENSDELFNVVIDVEGKKTSVDFTVQTVSNTIQIHRDYETKVKTPERLRIIGVSLTGNVPSPNRSP